MDEIHLVLIIAREERMMIQISSTLARLATATLVTCSVVQAQAPSGQPITLGLIAEQSGPLGFYGQETVRAATTMVSQMNAAGGLLGRPLKLIVRDSKTSVNDAVREARDLLYTENVDFLFHSINSGECVAVGNIAKQAKKIMFSNCANTDFTGKDGGKYLFRIPNITARTQAYSAADYINRHYANAGNRYYTIAHDFAFGRNVVDEFKKHMKELNPNAQFVGESWPKLNEASYAPFITAMIDAKPSVVFYTWGSGLPFFQQSASFELTKKFPMASSYWGGSDELQVLPKEAIPTGAVMGGIPWYMVEDPSNAAFVDAFRKAYNKPPLTAAYLTMISMQAFRTGIEKAKSIEADAVVAALEGLTFDSVVGPVTIRPFDHQGTTPLWTGKAGWDDKRNMGVFSEVEKLPTAKFLPSEEEVRKTRQ
jgi:branched-chain amino acid transport system substrate-binding protein